LAYSDDEIVALALAAGRKQLAGSRKQKAESIDNSVASSPLRIRVRLRAMGQWTQVGYIWLCPDLDFRVRSLIQHIMSDKWLK